MDKKDQCNDGCCFSRFFKWLGRLFCPCSKSQDTTECSAQTTSCCTTQKSESSCCSNAAPTQASCCSGDKHEHKEGECCCSGEKHEHKEGECCCGGEKHEHKEGECCCGGEQHEHKEGECCCSGEKHEHKEGECCCNGEKHEHKEACCCCSDEPVELHNLLETLAYNNKIIAEIRHLEDVDHNLRAKAALMLRTDFMSDCPEWQKAKKLVRDGWEKLDPTETHRHIKFLVNKNTVGEVLETLKAQIEKQHENAKTGRGIRNFDYIKFMQDVIAQTPEIDNP